MNKFFIILIGIMILSSCRTQKDVLYLQNINDINISNDNYENLKIQTGDALTILVNAYDENLAKPFNLGGTNTAAMAQRGGAELSPTSYLVDSEGNIEYPMLGTIHAAGKTRKELSEELKTKIGQYIQDPMVNIRILNFRITMLGEFNTQGVITSSTEKLNILEAIANAGGMSYYAIRDSVLIVRNQNGQRTHTFVNLHDANLINSEYYYLKQNDILYALPTKSRAMEFNTRPLTSVLTVVGFVTAILALFK